MNKERELLKKACDILANAKLAKPEDIEILNAIYIELDKPEKTRIVWIPNTGVKPDCKIALIRYDDGFLDIIKNTNNTFGKIFNLDEKFKVAEYAIIE